MYIFSANQKIKIIFIVKYMNHINLDNMFPSTNKKYDPDNNDKFNIETLFKSVKHPKHLNVPDKVYFDVNKLKQEREDIANKIIYQYTKYFNNCLEKIKQINKTNNTSVYYEVPLKLYMQNTYNSIDCLNFIQNKLKLLNIKSEIVSDVKMFVDWSKAHCTNDSDSE